MYGKTYLKYGVEVIPMLDYSESSIKILGRKYFNFGGEFILNEPIMNFGLSGVVIFFIIERALLQVLCSEISNRQIKREIFNFIL